MGFWSNSSSECEDNGGHDQRMHTRTDESSGDKSTVVDCTQCGKEWEYDENGRRK